MLPPMGALREQIEGVRVAASHRGNRIGEAMVLDAETAFCVTHAASCRPRLVVA